MSLEKGHFIEIPFYPDSFLAIGKDKTYDNAYCRLMKDMPARSPDLITPEMIAPCGMDCALCMAISSMISRPFDQLIP
jgi:hypothetical protein